MNLFFLQKRPNNIKGHLYTLSFLPRKENLIPPPQIFNGRPITSFPQYYNSQSKLDKPVMMCTLFVVLKKSQLKFFGTFIFARPTLLSSLWQVDCLALFQGNMWRHSQLRHNVVVGLTWGGRSLAGMRTWCTSKISDHCSISASPDQTRDVTPLLSVWSWNSAADCVCVYPYVYDVTVKVTQLWLKAGAGKSGKFIPCSWRHCHTFSREQTPCLDRFFCLGSGGRRYCFGRTFSQLGWSHSDPRKSQVKL